nr:transcription regulator [Tanacetum cinerariifolium]
MSEVLEEGRVVGDGCYWRECKSNDQQSRRPMCCRPKYIMCTGGDPSGYVPTYSTRNTTSSKLVAELVFLEATKKGISLGSRGVEGHLLQLKQKHSPPMLLYKLESYKVATTRFTLQFRRQWVQHCKEMIEVILYVDVAIDTTAIRFKRSRFGFTLNIELLVTAAKRRETPIEAPPSKTQDKISFIINNLSIANIEPKVKLFT